MTGVTHLSVGDRGALRWLGKACGRCQHCLSGWETLCEQQINTGYGCDGGYAEKMPAWADFAQPVPEGVGAVEAAPLICAGVTTELGADLVNDARKQDVGKALRQHGAAVNSGLRRGGKLVMVALPAHGTIQVPIFGTVLNGTSMIGSIVGTRQDLAEVFQPHAAGRTRVIHETLPAIDEVLRGQVKACIVFDLGTER